MKKNVFTAVLMIFSLAMVAQESAIELKNAGNAAVDAKDYKVAYAKYLAYVNHADMLDEDVKAYTYNCGYCAYKIKKYPEAINYFNKSVELDYKPDLASYQIALCKKKSGDAEGYIEDMKMLVETYPKSKYYKKYFLSAVTKHYSKLAAVPYNEANDVASQAATSGDAGVYLKKMKEAIAKWEEAEVHFNKVLELDASNAAALGALANIKSQIKSYEDYRTTLKEN